MAKQTTRRFFVGFGFEEGESVGTLYRNVHRELSRRCGIHRNSPAHFPHITVLPPGQSGMDFSETAKRMKTLSLPTLSIGVGGWGWFDGTGDTQTLYLGIELSESFLTVVTTVEQAMGGFLRRRDPYVPHVTFVQYIPRSKRRLVEACLRGHHPIHFSKIPLSQLALFVNFDGVYQKHECVTLGA